MKDNVRTASSPSDSEHPNGSTCPCHHATVEYIREFLGSKFATTTITAEKEYDLASFVFEYQRELFEIVRAIPPPFPYQRYLKAFAEVQLVDGDLPLTQETLDLIDPHFEIIPPFHRSKLLKAQTRALFSDMRKGEHRVFNHHDPVPFVQLPCVAREGAFGSVTKVAAMTDQTQIYACKKMKMDKEELEDEGNYIGKLSNLAELDHPHILKLHCTYVQSGHLHLIVSPYAEFDLKEFLKHPGCIPDYQAGSSADRVFLCVRWMACLLSALTYLHDLLLKHRDIKPANIMLHRIDGQFIPLIGDFGSSKKYTVSQSSRDVEQEGTDFYQSPEGAAKKPSGRKGDVFALGCVFVLLLGLINGQCPILIIHELKKAKHGSTDVGFAAHISAVKFFLTDLTKIGRPSEFKEKLVELVFEMLDEDPEKRISAREAFKKITSACNAGGIALHCTKIPPTPPGSTSSLGPDKQDEVDLAMDRSWCQDPGIAIPMDFMATWEQQNKRKSGQPTGETSAL